MFKIYRAYTNVVIWLGVILYLSSTTPDGKPKFVLFTIPYFDKIVHWGMYSILTFLMSLLYYRRLQDLKLRNSITIFVIAVLYGGIMEVCQHYFWEGRSADFLDMFANAVGAVSGIYVYKICNRIIVR